MALPTAFSSVTSLAGGIRVNSVMGLAGYEDLGGKVALALSAINLLTVQVSYIQSLLTSANLSAVGFSALSTTAFSNTYVQVSNFSST